MNKHKALSGKIALVTGAGRGIGREIALRLASDGASIIVHYASSKAGADRTVAEVEAAGGDALAYPADIAKRSDVRALFAAIDRNTVIPGATSPGMMDNSVAHRAFFENASPFKWIGTAGEIAAVVAFLASPEAGWVSGTHILANAAANA